MENQIREPILSVRDLHVSFKTDDGLVHAVRGVSFDLFKGETFCIVGESGSGKSVTSKTIMGILSANAVIKKGSVMYEGEDLTKIDESEFHRIRGHKIGMIFQDPLSSLNPIMKVGKQITEAMLVNKDRLKSMYDHFISKEESAYKNSLVQREMVYQRARREEEELQEKYLKQQRALEKRADEKSYAISLLQKELRDLLTQVKDDPSKREAASQKESELLEAKKQFVALKVQTKEEIALLMKEEKKVLREIRVRNKEKEAEADRKFKEEKPALKKALDSKKKEAKSGCDKFRKEKMREHQFRLTELKGKLESAKTLPEAERKNALSQARLAIRQENEDFRSYFRISKKEAKAAALKVMKEVGIPQPEVRFHQYPFEFSGGMRQRIVIAIALTANPEILICDEPTTALDVTIQAQILELINRLKAERNMSIIFISHDLGVVANMADRVAVMYAGKIVEVGTAQEIFYDPRHPYTWALLSSIPDLDSHEKLEAIPGTPPYLLNPPKGDAFAARNRYAMQVDFEKEPPFFRISDTHYAATWLLDKRAPQVEKPRIVSQRIKASLEKAGIQHD